MTTSYATNDSVIQLGEDIRALREKVNHLELIVRQAEKERAEDRAMIAQLAEMVRDLEQQMSDMNAEIEHIKRRLRRRGE